MKAEVKSKLNPEDRVELQNVIPLETPFLLYVDPSSACNFRCQFCPTGHIDLIKNSDYKRSLMGIGLFEKLIDELAEFSQPLKVMRMNKIGEPLLNKQLAEMIALAKHSGRVQHIDLATNGALFTEELLTKMITAGLDRLNISLEGINAEQYLQHAKVKIDFPEFVRKIKWLYANKGDYHTALDFYHKSLKIGTNTEDKFRMSESLYNIGNVCFDKGEYHKAFAPNLPNLF